MPAVSGHRDDSDRRLRYAFPQQSGRQNPDPASRSAPPMTLTIRPAVAERPEFVGEVAGIDLRQPISTETAAAIEAGMDRFAVLVFHDQAIDDAQQLAFSRHFGPIELATGDIHRPEQRRLSMEVNDISNLDKENNVLARDDRKRLFSLGNQLWHSDSSFKAIPA